MDDGYRVVRPRRDDVYDWAGRQLHLDIRRLVGVGHIVRVQVSGAGWGDTPYLRVTGQDGDLLTGVVDDPYRSEHSALDNGAVIEFDRADVTEIPLDWPENAALAPEATYTGTGRDVTGWLDPQ